MSNLKYAHTVFIDNESGLDSSWADGIHVFCKDTGNVWILNNGAFYKMSGSTGTGEANTASSVGSGNSLYKQKTGVNLEFRSISAGTGITIVTGDTWTISSSTATTVDGWTVIIKSADQDITAASFQNDNDFSFSVDAGGFYMVECDFVFSNTVASTTQGRFAVDAGTLSGRGHYVTNVLSAVFVTGAANTNTLTLTSQSTPTLGFPEKANISYAFQSSNSTTFRWTFGSTSNTTRLWKGSILKYKKLN